MAPITHVNTPPPQREIDRDRRCAGCGYNLRGLLDGGRCPECGLPVQGSRRIDDPLSLMPVSVIKAFRRGCLLASVCLFVVVGVVAAGTIAGWSGGATYPLLLTGALAIWIVAVWWLTPAFELPQAVRHGFSHASRLRSATRWLQLGMPLGAVISGLGLWLKVSALVTVGLWIGVTFAIAGAVALSVLLQRLADWARDEDAERALNWTAWGLPAATLLLVITPPFLLLKLLLLGIWVISVLAFPYGLLTLSKSVTLSVLHAREHQDRERRRSERRRRQSQAMVARAMYQEESGGGSGASSRGSGA